LRQINRPTIVEANEIAPAYSKLYKEVILATSPQKPVAYGSKGDILRKATLAQYFEEIDAL
jgi:hypothetical protein